MIKIRIILILIFAFLIVSSAYAATYNKFLDSKRAIQKTPDQLMRDYQEGKINSSQFWIRMPLEEKIRLVDLLKKRFKDEDGVVIKKSAEFYTVLLDKVYNEHPEYLMESIRAIFAAVAMHEDDFYEEGMTLGESMKKWFGDTFLIDRIGQEEPSKEMEK